MKFESFIAWKHLTRRRRTGFISLISMISILGVCVGVMALIVVLSVMSGFDRELKNKIVNVQPHLRIEKSGGMDDMAEVLQLIRSRNIPGLQSMAGYIEGQAMIRSQANATGVIVKGIDSAREDLEIYSKHLVSGDLDLSDKILTSIKRFMFFFKRLSKKEMGRIMIGENLASTLRVGVGDQVSLIAPFRNEHKKLSLESAETQTFIVSGIFRVGMNDFDTALVLIDLGQAQKLYHLDNKVTGISLRFANVDDAQKWKYILAGDLSSDFYLRSWYDMNHTFFQALKVEKSVMTILLGLIILVATFNIVSTLTMVVMEKTKDIGIMRAIGATRASIRRIFVFEGFSIGFIGIVCGAITGLLFSFNLNAISDFLKRTTGLEVFPSDIYYFDRIPVEIHPEDVVLTVTFALIAALIAGVFPAHRAAQLNPIEALRYE